MADFSLVWFRINIVTVRWWKKDEFPKLVNAMRVGSQSPLDEREDSDLGHYGLGIQPQK
jgi:hypothetical protein